MGPHMYAFAKVEYNIFVNIGGKCNHCPFSRQENHDYCLFLSRIALSDLEYFYMDLLRLRVPFD